MEKPSFAKIAAAGFKPSSALHDHPEPNNDTQNHTSSLTKENTSIDHSANSLPSSATDGQPLTLVQNTMQRSKESNTSGPEVLLHRAQSTAVKEIGVPARDGLLTPGTSEENGTHVSTSSDPTKPPSIDGKSVASGTTFALDEKESLRPDDSASLKAVDDEDLFPPSASGIPGSHVGSDDGMRAFRDQWREIASMEPTRHIGTSQSFGMGSSGVLYVPPHGPGVGLVPSAAHTTDEASTPADSSPDPKLLEALESPRDRIWVLKLEQDIFDFVKDPKESSLNLPQCNAYHRMLAHKIADYYMLGHLVDDSASAVRLFKTPNCRIPPPLTAITTPSTAASTPPPTAPPMKILRRGGSTIANGSGIPSKTTSENGASGTEDDGKPKPPASREEREARYEAARLRIMGSAKPTESADDFKEHEESRLSSAAGKKKKKQRSDSEDGFEARSAFSAFYAQPYSSNGFPSASYFGEPSSGSVLSHSGFNGSGNNDVQQQYPPMTPPTNAWQNEALPIEHQNWSQPQQPGYELSGTFQRAMSFQNANGQSPGVAVGYNTTHPPQCYGGAQPTWPQQASPMPPQPPNGGYGYQPGYQPRPATFTGQGPDGPSYQYGQLPSQAFPGRPPNKLEHPLPGSYKSKHFNPQSQSFVPNQPGAMPFRPFTPQGTVPLTGFGSPQNMTMQRQGTSHTQSSGFSSPHHNSPAPSAMQAVNQPIMHPLPQPVFPQQPSPSLPLPPKPGSTPHRYSETQISTVPGQPTLNSPGGSSIAKWGTPASLPAKPPPPSIESFDTTRYPQVQRQLSYNNAAAARIPTNAMPNLGSMTAGSASYVVNGSGNKKS
ncbi:Hypothetical protein R9X50_00376500 [Acrodontium crateriforme]|uniref:R3H domain-containing protein 2 n=1 Tax=Acrodontium crateriforme TaxID=150365 RepID=A0AAQ3R9N9_9PEZI|nr:Hypothetical protein R9X50_00376500 [Acrodontium crateriforme]